MKAQTLLIALVLPFTVAAFVVGPRAPTFSKRTTRVSATNDWAGDSIDFINKIPDIPTKKETPKPKEPEPVAPPKPDIPSATEPIGVSSSEITSPPPEPVAPPPPPKPVEVPKAVVPAPAPAAASSTSVELPSDLPIPIIAGGALAAFAAATFAMRGGVDEREASQSGGGSSSPAPAPSGGSSSPAPAPSDDLSIPYDAAAKLAYEKSDKSMPYDKFKEKYEADAVADVKAKQKK
jgi:hypothetical protein